MTTTRSIGIIPARMSSSRFPGKPLALLDKQTVLERVWRHASEALDNVYITSDSPEIEAEALRLGAKFVSTPSSCISGTHRCLCAFRELGEPEADVIVNVQADEPFLTAADIALVADDIVRGGWDISTLIRRAEEADAEEIFNHSAVKVVTDSMGCAMYFSRAPIPFLRDIPGGENWVAKGLHYLHCGIYAFRASQFEDLASLPPSPLHIAENLEQLTWLQNGWRMHCNTVDHPTIGIDTQADISKARQLLNDIK